MVMIVPVEEVAVVLELLMDLNLVELHLQNLSLVSIQQVLLVIL